MGAWGVGNFDNDDALDWVYELEESHSLVLVIQTLRVVDDADSSNYLESPDCACALAAAEVVVALNQAPSPELTEEVNGWVDDHGHLDTTPHLPLALRVVARIRADSELKDLWEESDYYAEWIAVIEELDARLRSGFDTRNKLSGD